MSPANEVHIVFLEEESDDVRSEGEADSSLVLIPVLDILVWIGPKKIAE